MKEQITESEFKRLYTQEYPLPEGEWLDKLAKRFDLKRHSGETCEAFRKRISDYMRSKL